MTNMQHPWFRFRPVNPEDPILDDNCYNHHSFNEIARKSKMPLRSWQDTILYADDEDLDAFEICQHHKVRVMDFTANGVGLYIHSPHSGNGKSTWAYKIAREYMEQISSVWILGETQPVYYVNVPQLLNELKQSFGDDNALRRIDKYVMQSALVIFDDIGAENATDWAREKLYQYIDYRYANGLACIFTSNKSVDTLDFRIADRIKGMCKIVTFVTHSKRTT